MPGYLVDEGGERTHAVIPVEEYERLKLAVRNLEAVRQHATEIMTVISREDSAEREGARPARQPATHSTAPDSPDSSDSDKPETPAGGDEAEKNRPRGYGWQS